MINLKKALLHFLCFYVHFKNLKLLFASVNKITNILMQIESESLFLFIKSSVSLTKIIVEETLRTGVLSVCIVDLDKRNGKILYKYTRKLQEMKNLFNN